MAEEDCPLISSFVTRQLIIFLAGCAFLLITYIRKVQGYETRDLRTFAADVSKQGLQQGFGGLLMAAVGVLLANHNGLDALAWYGGEYPFEIVMTTFFTHTFRKASEKAARYFVETSSATELWKPMLHMGRYCPPDQEGFRWSWYLIQMVQAVLLIGIPARLLSVGLIVLSMALPSAIAPVNLVASAWYYSGMTCAVRTVATLYVMPVVGDMIQFFIVDQIQKATSHDESSMLLSDAPSSSSSTHSA